MANVNMSSCQKVDEVQGMLQHFTSMSLKKSPASNTDIAEISSLSIKDQT